MNGVLEYSYKDSFVHNRVGATKLIFLISFITAAMISYDTRFLLGMLGLSVVIFKLSKVKFKDISFVFYFILVFLVINSFLIYLIAPMQGTEIYGTSTELFRINNYFVVTSEQLFYQFNFILKYLIVTPIALVFLVSTDPSEFAASLNKIGISYRVAYSVAIALRYIPDIQREYKEISFAKQARGLDMSKKVSLLRRLKNSTSVIMPIIFSSLEKIEMISCAMELRAFGEKKKRTWYKYKKWNNKDYIVFIISISLIIIALGFCYTNGGRFYNPFR
ncbi:MAG: energy-coupling factor transporter transmembrane component T family protein [Clostridium sp.]